MSDEVMYDSKEDCYMVPEELFEEMEKAVAERDELAAELERVKAERKMSDAELNIVAGHVAECWLYLDAWARSESATIEDVKEICKTLLRKQQAPGWAAESCRAANTQAD